MHQIGPSPVSHVKQDSMARRGNENQKLFLFDVMTTNSKEGDESIQYEEPMRKHAQGALIATK